VTAAAVLASPAGVRAEAPRASAGAAPLREPPPDPAAIEAGDANLESTSARQGISFTFGFGGALSVGFGMENATGQGGALTLRLAHVANARSVVAVELSGVALFFSVAGSLYQTNQQSLMLAGMYYLNPALWIRGAIGVGRYGGEELRMDDLIMRERLRLTGPAGSVGAGVDLIRLRRFRAGVEFSSTALFNSDGVLSSNGFLFGLTLD
jgi:hypothetical protein